MLVQLPFRCLLSHGLILEFTVSKSRSSTVIRHETKNLVPVFVDRPVDRGLIVTEGSAGVVGG